MDKLEWWLICGVKLTGLRNRSDTAPMRNGKYGILRRY